MAVQHLNVAEGVSPHLLPAPRRTRPRKPLYLPDVTGMTLLDAALAYAKAGWFILPVRAGTKNPGSLVGPGWQSKSTRSVKTIRAWWAKHPDAGIALHVGRSGAVAFDADVLHLAVIVDAGRPDIAEALAGAVGVNGTRKPEVSTERAHYLFSCEVDEFGCSAGDFERWGEVRGKNGVIIVAPTPHPDVDTKDGLYWQIRTGELTPVPEVLRAVLAAPGKVAEPLSYDDFESWLDDDADGNEKTCGAKGCKHSIAGLVAKFANKVAGGASRYETMTKDIGPWGFREAQAGCYRKRAVLDALVEAYEAVKPGHRNELYRGLRWAVAQADADPGDVHPDVATEKVAAQLKSLVTAAALDTMTFAPLIEHVSGLVTEGYTILSGPPKAGKSWLTASLALACAQGGIALGGVPVAPRHVLLLALEDGHRRLQARMRRLNGNRALPARLDILTVAEAGTILPTIAAWLALRANDTNPPLVILDTLGRAMISEQGLAVEASFKNDYEFGCRLKQVIDAVSGAALVAVHHNRKMGSEDFLASVSGTYGVTAAADSILVLARARTSSDGTLSVTGRDIKEAEYALVSADGVWSLDGNSLTDAQATLQTRRNTASERSLSDRSQHALAFIRARPSTTPKDLAAKLRITEKLAGNLLSKLCADKRIAKVKRGVYAPLPAPVGSGESGESSKSPGQSATIFHLPLGESGESGESAESISPLSPAGGENKNTSLAGISPLSPLSPASEVNTDTDKES